MATTAQAKPAISSRAASGLILLLGAAVFLNYVDRGAIAVAAPLMKGELGLSATGFGIAVSAFFWVYAPIQLAVGWLCDRFPVYRLLAAGLFLWALTTSAIAAALALGPAVGTLAGGMLMINFGWRAMFVVCGLATLLWLLPWSGLTRTLPPEHRHAPADRFPLKTLIGTRALLTTSICHFAANYSFYFLLAWLPL